VDDDVKKSILAERLKATREERGLTQAQLNRLCGFGVNQISRFETGIRSPATEALVKIATILDVSMDYLAGLTDNPHGQVIPTDLNVYEREIISTYREEGWSGIARLGVERLSK